MSPGLRQFALPLALGLGLLAFAPEARAERLEDSGAAALHGSSDSSLLGVPIFPEFLCAPEIQTLKPGIPIPWAAAVEHAFEPILVGPSPSATIRDGVLVAAEVLDHYRSFRESLSTP